jgi:hypothetical protein
MAYFSGISRRADHALTENVDILYNKVCTRQGLRPLDAGSIAFEHTTIVPVGWKPLKVFLKEPKPAWDLVRSQLR